MDELGSNWKDVYENLYLRIFLENSRENSSFIKIIKQYLVLYINTVIRF